MKQLELQHLNLRSGFGESLETVQTSLPLSKSDVINSIFKHSSQYTLLSAVPPDAPGIGDRKNMSADERKEMRMLRNEYNKRLNIAWLQRMCSTEEALREKMTFLWHGHFACRDEHPLFAQSLNNTIRRNALGKFSELLTAVSKEAAMLQFLNNRQNKKASPNENFAREVMELFTLGRGNYSETDVREAARAFTGWNFDEDGIFVIHEKMHDTGKKEVFGKRGNFTGEDVLSLILERRECALYIAGKLYSWFVNDTPNRDIIASLAKDFYESDYDITALLRNMFNAEWFYKPANIGAKIKSPVELIAGTARLLQLEYTNPYPLINAQRVMGQYLFNPPNVAGWKGGKDWIDSSSLMFRLNFADKVLNASEIKMVAKPDDDMLEKRDRNELEKMKNLSIVSEKNTLAQLFSGKNSADIKKELSGFLLQTPTIPEIAYDIKTLSDFGASFDSLKPYCVKLMSLPEYQLM